MKRNWIGAAVALVILAAMVGYLGLQRDVLTALTAIPVWMAGVIVLAAAMGLVFQALQFRTALTIHDTLIGVKESVALTAANTMANYYLPVRGGMLVRAAYMKWVYRFPLSQYAAVTVSITGLTILTAAVVGLMGVGIIAATEGGADTRALWAFGGVGVAVVLGLVIAIAVSGVFDGDGRLAQSAAAFRSGMGLWVHARGRLAIFLGWTLLVFGAQAMRLWLSFRAVGVTVSVGSMLVIQAMAFVVFVLALTPGNIGLKEGAVVFAASLLGIDPALALLASLIDRAGALVVTFGVGSVSLRYLSRRAAAAQSDAGELLRQVPGEV
jgi:uncharacterized membrane protein YbhN (UPF0104 family)